MKDWDLALARQWLGREAAPQISAMVSSPSLASVLFNRGSDTSRADLQLDLRLDVLGVQMKDPMRLGGDNRGCLDGWFRRALRCLCRCEQKTKQMMPLELLNSPPPSLKGEGGACH